MDVAFALAVALEAHALEAIVVVDRERNVVASAGRAAPAPGLLGRARATCDEPLGAFRSFDSGRGHVEVVVLGGVACVVALRRETALDDPCAITQTLQASLHRDETDAPRESGDEEDDDDFDFDLGWGDSPTDALRDVVG